MEDDIKSKLNCITFMVNNKKCIAVLTKGYQDISDYHKLILRNECIEKKMNDLC